MKKLLILFLMMGCALGAKAQNYNLQGRIQAFEADLKPFLAEMENIGMSVVFVKDNQIVYHQHFGVKNVETGAPLTDNTLFRIASISKSFTCTSLMQLVSQGKVSLKTDASELAGFPIRNPKYPETTITLEMMLSHTSSLNDSQGYFTLDVLNPELNPDYAKCYNDYRPGEGYEYCNLNYNMCGSFLEKLSGEQFDEYVINHVLNPLHLYGGYRVDLLDKSLFASLYRWEEDHYVLTDDEAYEPRTEKFKHYTPTKDTALFSPTGGMKISALHLARYMLMHMNYGTTPDGIQIIPKELSLEMQTPRSSDENYGLALWKTEEYSPGTVLTGHTGGAYGMRSAMFFHPEEKYGFIVISNGAHEVANDGKTNILQGALSRMFKHFIGA